MTHNMTRIVGGVDVEANEYPWQVGLVHCTTLYCTVLYCTVLYCGRWGWCTAPPPGSHSAAARSSATTRCDTV